ncbi:hypothetical protein BADSM9389_16010 [Buttiauxella agrestis]|nr:hypothetical protein BADSM9389_16010 [Buttiauxella agrestis]
MGSHLPDVIFITFLPFFDSPGPSFLLGIILKYVTYNVDYHEVNNKTTSGYYSGAHLINI